MHPVGYILTLLCILTHSVYGCAPTLKRIDKNDNATISSPGLGESCVVNSIPYTTVYNNESGIQIGFEVTKNGANSVDIEGITYTSIVNMSITFIGSSASIPAELADGVFRIYNFPLLCYNSSIYHEFMTPPSDITTASCNEECAVNGGDDVVKKFNVSIAVPLSTIASVSVGDKVIFAIVITTTGENFAIVNISLSDNNKTRNFAFDVGGECDQSLRAFPSDCWETSSASYSVSETQPEPAVIDVDHRLTGIEMMLVIMSGLIVFSGVVASVILFA